MRREQARQVEGAGWRWNDYAKAAAAGVSLAVLAACGGGGDDVATERIASESQNSSPGTPSTPVSDGGITPYIIEGKNPGGNRTCAEVGQAFFGDPNYYEFSSARVNYNDGSFDQSFPEGLTVTTNDGTNVTWSATGFTLGAVIVKGSNDANVYVYPYVDGVGASGDSGLAPPPNASGGSAGLSNITFCWNGGTLPPAYRLTVDKFYDRNTDGVKQDDEPLLTGWKVNVAKQQEDETFTSLFDDFTPVDVTLDAGTYRVSEYQPTMPPMWYPTTPTSVDRTLPPSPQSVTFGNVCTGAGNGRTMGFWSNRNGQALIGVDDLAGLVALNLRNANGSNFDPATNTAYRNWLLAANATNMAYMLSAQMSAMWLNVYNGLVDGNALIYAPGTTSANAAGFATVNAIIAEANASLGANGITVAAGPERTYQEALKNALDNANNNRTFVQPTPCEFTFSTN